MVLISVLLVGLVLSLSRLSATVYRRFATGDGRRMAVALKVINVLCLIDAISITSLLLATVWLLSAGGELIFYSNASIRFREAIAVSGVFIALLCLFSWTSGAKVARILSVACAVVGLSCWIRLIGLA